MGHALLLTEVTVTMYREFFLSQGLGIQTDREHLQKFCKHCVNINTLIC